MEKINLIKNEHINKKFIFHSSDIHIENINKRYDEYKLIFDKVACEIKKFNADECVICFVGDIIEFKNNVTIEGINMLIYFLQFFGNLCDVVIISGQHDANPNDERSMDLIECCHSYIRTKYSVNYLKHSGLYKLNNVIFSVASIFDRKIIDPKKIQKNDDEILVALHHGFVLGNNIKIEKLPYPVKDNKYYRSSDFKGYDIVMLGDIHVKNFITDNIAYCSSLIQRNHGEPTRGHGIIIWDIEKKKGTFIEILNDYGLVTKVFKNGKMLSPNEKLPKNAVIKIKLNNTDKILIDDELKKIRKQCNVIGEPKIENIKNKFTIETDGGIKIDKFDMTDNKLVNALMKEYMIKTLKYDKNDKKINEILRMHNDYRKDVKVKSRTDKNIKFLNLKFDNVFSYGKGNVFLFDCGEKINTLIKGKNGFGKSAIIDILCFVLYEKLLRGNKSNILNVRESKYFIELNLKIDDNDYKIIRSGNKKIKHGSINYEYDCEIYKNDDKLIDWGKRCQNDYIIDLLGLDYEEFIFFCLMPKDSKYEIIDKDNSEKKELVSKILNIDYFENIYENVKKDLDKEKMEFEKKKIIYSEIIDNYDESKKFDQKYYDDLNKKSDGINKKIKKYNDELETLKEKILNVDCDDDKQEILDNIKEFKKNIKDQKNKIMVIKKGIDKNRKKKSDIIIPQEVKDQIKNIVIDENCDDVKLNNVLYDLIQNNIDVVKDIHDEEVELLEDSINAEKKLKDYMYELDISNKKMKNYNKYEKIIIENAKCKEKIKKINDLIQKEEDDLYDVQKLLKDMDEQKKIIISENDYNEASKKFMEMKKEIELKNIYLEIINSNAFPTSIFKLACIDIEKLMNELLVRVDANYKMKIEFVSYEKGKKINTSIILYKVNGLNKIDSCCASTSERFYINLLFKIALHRYFNISIPSFIIIDEQYENVDNDKLCSIDNIFDVLHDVYDDVYVVSHLYQIAQLCTNVASIVINDKNSFLKM